MFKFDVSEYQKIRPQIQLAPMVDIAFWALMFFMIIAVFNQMESQVNITVPKSNAATESLPSAGKLIINVTREGRFILNQQELDGSALEAMLAKVYKLFPNQQVIIRADAMAYHKYIIQALDACMRANITDVAFSTVKGDDRE